MTTVFARDPNQMDEQQFHATFSGVYERTPWIARQLWEQRAQRLPTDVESFSRALAAIVNTASAAQKLALITAHPDLAGRAAIAGQVTAESRGEQASAGLDQCTPEELARFRQLNDRYKTKFGFPFIMAVKGANRQRILEGFVERIDNDRETELSRAISEINKIAKLRLEEIAQNG